MSNIFRRTTTTTTSNSTTKAESTPPTPRNPYIVGTRAWVKFANNGQLQDTVTRNTIYASKRTRGRKSRPTMEQITKNSELIDKILNFTYQNSWVHIEGGENDGKWLNMKHYGNKIFESGKIYEYATNETHYFPIADTYDDPMGIALNYKRISGAGMYCSIGPNTWTTHAMRSTVKKKKRAQRKKQEHEDNHDISHHDISHHDN